MIKEVVLRELFDEYVAKARSGFAAINHCRRLGCGTLISQIGVRHSPKGDHALFWCPKCQRWWTVPQREWRWSREPDAEGPHCEWPHREERAPWRYSRKISRKTKARNRDRGTSEGADARIRHWIETGRWGSVEEEKS